MRGRSASLTAFQAASMSPTWMRARPAITGPWTSRGDRLDRLEVARRGDREAGLDDVDAEARELVRDLQLLARVERDAGRLLAVAQRRVEDQYSVGVLRIQRSCRLFLIGSELRFFSDGFAACSGRHALFPPRGEEKKSKGELARHVTAVSLPALPLEAQRRALDLLLEQARLRDLGVRAAPEEVAVRAPSRTASPRRRAAARRSRSRSAPRCRGTAPSS